MAKVNMKLERKVTKVCNYPPEDLLDLLRKISRKQHPCNRTVKTLESFIFLNLLLSRDIADEKEVDSLPHLPRPQ